MSDSDNANVTNVMALLADAARSTGIDELTARQIAARFVRMAIEDGYVIRKMEAPK
jgi:hypothetical protein